MMTRESKRKQPQETLKIIDRSTIMLDIDFLLLLKFSNDDFIIPGRIQGKLENCKGSGFTGWV